MKRIAMIIRNDYGDMDNILSHIKTMETRETNCLKSHVGESFQLLTYLDGGKLCAVGKADICSPVKFDTEDMFDSFYDLHRVGADSRYHINKSKSKIKYGYPLRNVVAYENPIPVKSNGCSAVRYINLNIKEN